jgi:hypothetical protein
LHNIASLKSLTESCTLCTHSANAQDATRVHRVNTHLAQGTNKGEFMTSLSIKQASEETGKDRTTLLRAIQKGTITAKKDNNNSWTIEPSELFRVYERTLCTQEQNAHDATSVHTPNTDLAQGKNDVRTGQNNRIITQTDIELAQATTAREFLERQIAEQQERIKLLETIVSDLKQDKEIYRNQIKAITDQRQPQPAPEPVKTVRKRILGLF